MGKRWIVIIAVVAILAVIVPVGGTYAALRMEESDAFCASCHTQPELDYYQQEQSSQAATLAAFHAHTPKGDVRCIDCHSGTGTFGRASGLEQGAHDLLAYLSGHYHSPAITTNPLSDASCIKCHADVLPAKVITRAEDVNSIQSHFHDFYPYWHQQDPNAASCEDCHTSHTTGLSGDQFINNGATAKVCDACHAAIAGKVQ